MEGDKKTLILKKKRTNLLKTDNVGMGQRHHRVAFVLQHLHHSRIILRSRQIDLHHRNTSHVVHMSRKATTVVTTETQAEKTVVDEKVLFLTNIA